MFTTAIENTPTHARTQFDMGQSLWYSKWSKKMLDEKHQVQYASIYVK